MVITWMALGALLGACMGAVAVPWLRKWYLRRRLKKAERMMVEFAEFVAKEVIRKTQPPDVSKFPARRSRADFN